MSAEKGGKKPLFINVKNIRNRKCLLSLKNRSGSRAYMVLQDIVDESFKEITFRRRKRIRVLKGTYVIEAWLKSGNIGINPENIQYVAIENLFSDKTKGFRGKKIVADLFHKKEEMIIFEEITVADIIQQGV